MGLTWDEMCAATGAQLHSGKLAGTAVIPQITTDTRKISDGDLFIALRGENFDGADFAADALAKGAAAVLVAEPISADVQKALKKVKGAVLTVKDTLVTYQAIAHAWRMKFDIPVVAITGSNGKTTTKDLTAAVLSGRGAVCRTAANYNNEVGLPLTLLGITAEDTAAVVEIGMRGLGQIAALAPVAVPNIGIVTNVCEVHMELLGSIENIAKAKAELVEAIPAGGTVILNADDARVAAMRPLAGEGVRVLTYGISAAAEVRAEALRCSADGSQFMVTWANERHDYSIPLAGRHNVSNVLAALAAGFVLGLTPQEMQTGLQRLMVTKMRYEVHEVGAWTFINDAYNASPSSMRAAIETTAALYAGRKIAVLGDMLELGSAAEEAHRDIGRRVAALGFAALVTYGPQARWMHEEAEAAGCNAHHAETHAKAADVLRSLLADGDTVLFKGSRGMKMEEIIGLLTGKEAGH
ncbi:UDP-N-acetylmuramoyl-tripeptide--D-alanyl-D-alanine ligase [Selenomonas sp. oral taxon 126]|uniref:UDP-N-acetylmuramoyl-tripeptide--D-alanyl-D- alanine ligase n=1 Tax=Selenomonas sp. oral taxon 126 TaxID=712528 RepID=UPI0008077250|nr:UDP-N-acetylmuramoyl-tripeptide--D-alanyl-D-alanine ligase [Selenomonas sp. oral taxon 126]ANR70876.1 UDP-N-acetylmuramoyl-tripeptide--D-alanyl-D-alanine ligase [Selenomonas sp. oral taxon 126]